MNEYAFDNLTHETRRLQEELQYLISPKVTGKGESQIILDMLLFFKKYIFTYLQFQLLPVAFLLVNISFYLNNCSTVKQLVWH